MHATTHIKPTDQADPAPLNVLRIDSSSRTGDSVTRYLTDELIQRLAQQHGNLHVVERDVSQGLPFINADWVGANYTPAAQRTAHQQQVLALSDRLVEELQQADAIVIGAPIYNFSVPASLKAWIDLVARAGLTFRYSSKGPEGLLANKRAALVMASGGTAIGSAIDFASGYLRHVLGFIGIQEVEIIRAERLMVNREHSMQKVKREIESTVSQLYQNFNHAA